jgi:hypothetical protein
MKKINIISLLVLISAFFIGCAKTDFEPIAIDKLMGDSLIANSSIKQLIDSFAKDTDEYTYLKYGTLNSGLFTSDLIKSTKDFIIKGVVTSSDVDGNVYKYMTVQDFSTGQAFKISIDASGLSAVYPLGIRVWIRCNGLCIGNYAQSPQIGTAYYNTDHSIIKTVIKSDIVKSNGVTTIKLDTTYVTVYRKEPGRIELPIAMKAIHRFGMPDTTLVKADTMTIAQIKAAGASAFNKLVCIKNAFFTGNGADYNLPVSLTAEELIFAPSTNGIGYPQSREIQDGTGSIFVSTSEYSKFATTKLPDSSNRGNITALVGWYNDKAPGVNPSQSTSKIYHQITIRSLSDLGKGFEKFHAEVDK